MSLTNRLLQRLTKGPLICAEGYLFELERRGWVQIGPFVPEVVINDPSAVKQLHREFVRCGSDVIQAFTYYGHREKMRLIGKEHLLEDLNRKALEIAFEVKDEFPSDKDLLIAGNLSNSTIYVDGDDAQNKIVKDMFMEQASFCKEYNVDYIVGETYDYLGEAILALEAIQYYNLPSCITLAVHRSGLTREGLRPYEALNKLKALGCDVVGLNCARGPDTMLPLLKEIKENVISEIAALPVCYKTCSSHPTFQSLIENNDRKYLELDNYTCTRFDLGKFASDCVDLGVKYIGTCCGGAPHHIRSMAEALGRTVEASNYSADLTKHFVFGDNLADSNNCLLEENLKFRNDM